MPLDSSDSPGSRPRPEPPADAIQQLLASLWESNLPVMRERFVVLQGFADGLQAARSTPESRHGAAEVAHKLAGSLGMFGFPRGTDLARELEILLDGEDPADAAEVCRLTRELRVEVLPQG